MNEKNTLKTSDLLSRAELGLEITTRDDQDEFGVFLDAARASRRKDGRLRLVDTGKFSAFELEWLAEAGADIYTSDEARPNIAELGLLARACAKGNAVIAYFHRGALSEGVSEGASSWAFLKEIGRSGVDVHLTNRERAREPAELAGLADACRKAGRRLVYYHRGRLEAGLEVLARAGGWIHLSDEELGAADQASLLTELIGDTAACGAGVIIHLEKGWPVEVLKDWLKGGAFLLFKIPPGERQSRLRLVEEAAKKRKLDRRSYYLNTTLLP